MNLDTGFRRNMGIREELFALRMHHATIPAKPAQECRAALQTDGLLLQSMYNTLLLNRVGDSYTEVFPPLYSYARLCARWRGI
jgi:hypothetical protein